jgi:hypothetical protein
MEHSPKKMNQFLASERERLMLYLVNMASPYEGWGGEDGAQQMGWKQEEYRQFTERLRMETEKHWPELWQPIEGQNTKVEERAWAVAIKLRTYLRSFWQADNDYDRDWCIHRAREYHYRLHILPELLKVSESMRAVTAEDWLDRPPKRNPVAKALYELQERARKPSTAPRVCPNECERRYFLSTEKGQKFCPDCRRSEAARIRASKLKSYHENKDKWPSMAKRRKHG